MQNLILSVVSMFCLFFLRLPPVCPSLWDALQKTVWLANTYKNQNEGFWWRLRNRARWLRSLIRPYGETHFYCRWCEEKLRQLSQINYEKVSDCCESVEKQVDGKEVEARNLKYWLSDPPGAHALKLAGKTKLPRPGFYAPHSDAFNNIVIALLYAVMDVSN